MTNETQKPGRLRRARAALCAFARRATAGLNDAIGWLGLALLARGLWLLFGEAWALVAVGSILMLASLLDALLGGE
jgi:hypothetical protein